MLIIGDISVRLYLLTLTIILNFQNMIWFKAIFAKQEEEQLKFRVNEANFKISE